MRSWARRHTKEACTSRGAQACKVPVCQSQGLNRVSKKQKGKISQCYENK